MNDSATATADLDSLSSFAQEGVLGQKPPVKDPNLNPYYLDNNVTLHQGAALDVLRHLPPESVACIFTSPPYHGLRKYGDDPAEQGAEETLADYVEGLRRVFEECQRVLERTGTLWVNLGDAFSSKANARVAYTGNRSEGHGQIAGIVPAAAEHHRCRAVQVAAHGPGTGRPGDARRRVAVTEPDHLGQDQRHPRARRRPVHRKIGGDLLLLQGRPVLVQPRRGPCPAHDAAAPASLAPQGPGPTP